jgi:hypothetical protein
MNTKSLSHQRMATISKFLLSADFIPTSRTWTVSIMLQVDIRGLINGPEGESIIRA